MDNRIEGIFMEKTTARPLATGLTIIAGLARMAQHLNFAPVGALSLFAGARLRGWYAYALPILLMAVTDPFLGGYSSATPFVYASFLLSVWMGTKIRETENPLRIGGMALACSLQFFLLTNLTSWLWSGGLYAHNLSGLAACYTAAIPFFRHTLESDLLYTAVLFGAHAVLSRILIRAERVAPNAVAQHAPQPA
jgi:hypothetical protein